MNQKTYTVKEKQQRLLVIFKFLVSFLEKHNLRYVSCGGTILGAVRHKGFIPWDDDIDIYMPRKDYDKLLSLKSELIKEGYDVTSINDEGYYLPFAKIINKNTTIWEKKCYPYVLGLFIDVFPVDYFDLDDKTIKKIQIKSRRLFRRYQMTLRPFDFVEDMTHFNPLRLKIVLQRCLCKNIQQKYLDKYKKFEKSYTCYNGNKCMSMSISKGKILKSEWFDDTIDHAFEDTTIKIPKDYDGYLSLIYGNYMQLPPLEKRNSGHETFYIDLEKGKSLSEVRKEMNLK